MDWVGLCCCVFVFFFFFSCCGSGRLSGLFRLIFQYRVVYTVLIHANIMWIMNPCTPSAGSCVCLNARLPYGRKPFVILPSASTIINPETRIYMKKGCSSTPPSIRKTTPASLGHIRHTRHRPSSRPPILFPDTESGQADRAGRKHVRRTSCVECRALPQHQQKEKSIFSIYIRKCESLDVQGCVEHIPAIFMVIQQTPAHMRHQSDGYKPEDDVYTGEICYLSICT